MAKVLGIATLTACLFYVGETSSHVKNNPKPEVQYDCDYLNIGVVGASNTVRAKYRKNFDELLSEQCQTSDFFLYAKGGKGPAGQKKLVAKMLEDHADLDFVIVDPSANENYAQVADYINDVITLAEMVKDKNNDTTVVILTNTPLKGFSKWKEKIQQNVDYFNKELLENKLGRGDVIDYSVDTYSATEDPKGSDRCGHYCISDKIHFNTHGEEAAVKAVLDTVFMPQ